MQILHHSRMIPTIRCTYRDLGTSKQALKLLSRCLSICTQLPAMGTPTSGRQLIGQQVCRRLASSRLQVHVTLAGMQSRTLQVFYRPFHEPLFLPEPHHLQHHLMLVPALAPTAVQPAAAVGNSNEARDPRSSTVEHAELRARSAATPLVSFTRPGPVQNVSAPSCRSPLTGLHPLRAHLVCMNRWTRCRPARPA
jgi:hypothetical protein